LVAKGHSGSVSNRAAIYKIIHIKSNLWFINYSAPPDGPTGSPDPPPDTPTMSPGPAGVSHKLLNIFPVQSLVSECKEQAGKGEKKQADKPGYQFGK